MRFTEFLENHISKETVSFHMPGHKGRRIFDVHGMGAMIDNLVSGDITEIPGSDNLSQPQGIIRSLMDRYRTLYGSEESFISVGGSTLGLMASIMAANDIGKGEIAVARNSHKSIFNGIELAGADSIYIRPEILDCGIVGEVTPEAVENAFLQAADDGARICAVVVPNPNYYGICSPIKEIARIIHEHEAILIVDQAHGAHLRFMYPELSADLCDCADIVVESTHKTLASFTQTAIINVYNKSLVAALEEKVKMLQSTSPSYMLMKSLDMNAELIEKYGGDLFESWKMNLDMTYAALEEMGINYLSHPLHDASKILIDISDYGLSGSELSNALEERGIITELDSGRFAMCMSGIGNAKGDYERLVAALADIASNAGIKASTKDGETARDCSNLFALMNKERERMERPSAWEWVPACEAVGKVCAESITPYPPGVPLIVAGEIMDSESLAFAEEHRKKGEKVFGVTENLMVKVAKNNP